MKAEILEAAAKIFADDAETESYVPDFDNDIGIIIDAYVFVVQTKDGFNNVIFAKDEEDKSSMTLRDVFGIFYLFCFYHKLQFLRIEGSPRRYKFLKKMFPFCHFVQEKNQGRNIFYVKLG